MHADVQYIPDTNLSHTCEHSWPDAAHASSAMPQAVGLHQVAVQFLSPIPGCAEILVGARKVPAPQKRRDITVDC